MIRKTLGILLIGALAACGPAPRAVPPLPAAEEVAGAISTQPQKVWQSDLGYGLTAPVSVRGSALFATTTNRTVLALNPENGRRYWLRRFDAAISSGVAVRNGQLFFATEDTRGVAWALDATRGRSLWQRRIGGTRVRPLVLGDLVVFGTQDGHLQALNAQDGAVRWSARLGASVVLEPLLVNERILTATTRDTLYAIDPATGAISVRAALPGTPSAPARLVGNQLVVATHEAGVLSLDATSLNELNRHRVGAPVLAQPQVIQGAVFVLNRDGEVWRLGAKPERLAALEGAARTAFAVAHDQLIVGLLDGRVIGLDLTGRRLWQFQADRSAAAPIAIARGAVFVPLLNGDLVKLQ